jgi:hypothetical protein
MANRTCSRCCGKSGRHQNRRVHDCRRLEGAGSVPLNALVFARSFTLRSSLPLIDENWSSVTRSALGWMGLREDSSAKQYSHLTFLAGTQSGAD